MCSYNEIAHCMCLATLLFKVTFDPAMWQYQVFLLPLCPGVVALHGICASLSLQVPSNGKQKSLENCHAHSTPPVSHLWDNIHYPAICLWIITLHVAQGLVF